MPQSALLVCVGEGGGLCAYVQSQGSPWVSALSSVMRDSSVCVRISSASVVQYIVFLAGVVSKRVIVCDRGRVVSMMRPVQCELERFTTM